MISGRIGSELAVVAVGCVLALFLFPAKQGPYSAVNGPVSALQAARAASELRVAMVQAALSALGNNLISPLAELAWMAVSGVEFQPFGTSESTTILRC